MRGIAKEVAQRLFDEVRPAGCKVLAEAVKHRRDYPCFWQAFHQEMQKHRKGLIRLWHIRMGERMAALCKAKIENGECGC